jgi:hypothetical protein
MSGLVRSLVRLAVFALGWPVAIVLLLGIYRWYRAEYPTPAEPPPAVTGDRASEWVANRTLARYRALPPAEQKALRGDIDTALVSVPRWLTGLSRHPPTVLCIGEYHKAATRSFLAQRVFPRLTMQSLLLEATDDEVKGFLRRIRAGRNYFPLLGADVTALIRSAQRHNPGLRIEGIEETPWQRRARGDGGSRDRSMARNFWTAFTPGDRHVIVHGALHCSHHQGRLFRLLHRRAPRELAERMVNVQVLGAHQDGQMEAFVGFLDGIGVAPGDFVIVDTQALPATVRRWFALLDQQILRGFGTVVVFREDLGPSRDSSAGQTMPKTISRNAYR